MKILYFIGNLEAGGKERRLIELISNLTKHYDNFEVLLVLAYDQIDYEYFYELGINYIPINKKPNSKDFRTFIQLDKIVKKFKPDIIHTWGSMQTFYMIPTSILHRIPLLNSQITDAPPFIRRISFQSIINAINFTFSTVILANSLAGLKAYKVQGMEKSHVIHNGFDLSRIINVPEASVVKDRYNIITKYTVGMVASFTPNKDYGTFIKAASDILNKRKDISFLCVGAGKDEEYIKMIPDENKDFIKFLGRQQKIEEIMNLCDVGVLMSNPDTHGEGISNAIMEFMALKKPVIANSNGGNEELILNGETGYIIHSRSDDELSEKIEFLINNTTVRIEMGESAHNRIRKEFNMGKMIQGFMSIYNTLYNLKKRN